MKALIVEDDLIVRAILTALAQRRGHDVSPFGDAESAWADFHQEPAPLVILDWLLAYETDGLDLCRRIRDHAAGAATVIIAVTARTDANDLEALLKAGADDYLSRPVDAKLFDIRLAIAERRAVEAAKRVEAEQELKRLNDDLTRANEQLQDANEKLTANQTQLVQSEKMASLGQLAAGVAHEINNPVGFVKSNLGMLSDYVGVFKSLLSEYGQLASTLRHEAVNGQSSILERIDTLMSEENLDFILSDVDSLLAESLTGTERVREIAQSLKSFARLDEAEMQYADVNEGLSATIRMIWNELKYHCEITENLQPLPPILCFPGQLNQVFMNLLVNASQAVGENGEITVETEATEDEVIVRIADNGVGIPAENLPKLFNPFFTTKPVGQGTGLGLSVSYGIIKKHGGMIEVRSEEEVGTTFSVHLPITPERHD